MLCFVFSFFKVLRVLTTRRRMARKFALGPAKFEETLIWLVMYGWHGVAFVEHRRRVAYQKERALQKQQLQKDCSLKWHAMADKYLAKMNYNNEIELHENFIWQSREDWD